MTVEQLEKELEMMEIPQELYSIMVGGLPNEKLCIAKEDKWQVYSKLKLKNLSKMQNALLYSKS